MHRHALYTGGWQPAWEPPVPSTAHTADPAARCPVLQPPQLPASPNLHGYAALMQARHRRRRSTMGWATQWLGTLQ